MELSKQDIEQEIKEAAKEKKVITKMGKLADKMISRVNGIIKAERETVRKKLDRSIETVQTNLDNFINNMNDGFKKFEKKYEAMYTDIVRRVLFKMETRLFNVEIYNQAIVDLVLHKTYELEKANLPEGEEMVSFEQYVELNAKEHEQYMQKHADAFKEKYAQVEKEEEDVAIQETEEKDGHGDLSGDDKRE